MSKVIDKRNNKLSGLSPKDRRIRMILCIIFGVLFLVISLFIIATGYYQIRYGIHSPKWPDVHGKVVSSQVVEGLDSSKRGSMRRYTYLPEIYYSYGVSKIKYMGENLNFIQSGVGEKWATEKVEEYSVNKTIKVFYNQNDPQVSVLEPGGSLKYMLLTISTLIIFSVFFLLLTYACCWDYQRVKNAGI